LLVRKRIGTVFKLFLHLILYIITELNKKSRTIFIKIKEGIKPLYLKYYYKGVGLKQKGENE